MEARALRFASHLARHPLRRPDQEHIPSQIPRTRDPPLVVRTPLVSTPATDRACTPRKDISSLQTGIAAVRQAYDGRPVRPRRRLLGCFLGSVGLSCHLYSFLGRGCLTTARPGFYSWHLVNNVTIIYHEGRKSKDMPAWRTSRSILERQLYRTGEYALPGV